MNIELYLGHFRIKCYYFKSILDQDTLNPMVFSIALVAGQKSPIETNALQIP